MKKLERILTLNCMNIKFNNTLPWICPFDQIKSSNFKLSISPISQKISKKSSILKHLMGLSSTLIARHTVTVINHQTTLQLTSLFIINTKYTTSNLILLLTWRQSAYKYSTLHLILLLFNIPTLLITLDHFLFYLIFYKLCSFESANFIPWLLVEMIECCMASYHMIWVCMYDQYSVTSTTAHIYHHHPHHLHDTIVQVLLLNY